MSTTQSTPEQANALAARPPDQPVIMVNLLTFRAEGGREHFAQYSREVAPHLERVGARVIYCGCAPEYVTGEGGTPSWDAIVIVEYPTPSAFVQMITTGEYARVRPPRAAALERGDLIATSAWELTGHSPSVAEGTPPCAS